MHRTNAPCDTRARWERQARRQGGNVVLSAAPAMLPATPMPGWRRRGDAAEKHCMLFLKWSIRRSSGS